VVSLSSREGHQQPRRSPRPSAGRPGVARAVGGANARNPLSVIVPCHRVVGVSGSLTGYAGGLAAKRYLLDHEARTAGAILAA
jgi:methylated-DNA-[protein]-cysteine S-methyltransferase